MSNWIRDKVFSDVGTSVEIQNTLYDGRTKFQSMQVYDTSRFGRVLMLDNAIQTTEKDEFTYHEMMVHVPLNAHGNVKSVLIVGGGDGGALEEVLKHKSVEKVTMVEIDEEVISISKKYLPMISKDAFEDPRANIIIADAIKWVSESSEKFDVIILDRTDAITDASDVCGGLYTAEFYADCKRLMSDKGIMVAQAGMISFSGTAISQDLSAVSMIWRKASIFITNVPSYSGGFQAMMWAADWNIVSVTDDEIKSRPALPDLQYYNPQIHRASFALPNFAQEY